MRTKLKDSFKLFFTFFFIGLISFGGGYSMLTIIREKVVNKHQWIDDYSLTEMFTISEMTPGPIAINIATFVGGKLLGVLGSIIATIAVSLPSFFIIIIVSTLVSKYRNSEVLNSFLRGMRVAVIILLARAFKMFLKNTKHNFFSLLLMIYSAVMSFFLKINAIYIIIISFTLSSLSAFLTHPSSKKGDLLDASI